MEIAPDQNKNTGLIFNIQRYSLQDGPGIRTTVFLKGCPLGCWWCSNPESVNTYPEIMTNDMKCIKCGQCIEACPLGAIKVVDNMRRIDRDKCDLCLKCADVCPTGAIEKIGKYMTLEETLKVIEKDKPFYDNSGGGVTFSGGEPLVQWQFLLEICKLCKEKGISTALDTTGYARWEIMEKVLQYVDLVLYDIKHLDPLKHLEATGVSNEIILENIKKTANKVRTWMRIPVIPGFNDSADFFNDLIEFSKGLNIEKISLLPCHTWGEPKYGRLGREYALKGAGSMAPESLDEIKDLMESKGLVATVGR